MVSHRLPFSRFSPQYQVTRAGASFHQRNGKDARVSSDPFGYIILQVPDLLSSSGNFDIPGPGLNRYGPVMGQGGPATIREVPCQRLLLIWSHILFFL